MRILIADDDRTSRELLVAVLRRIGHDVVVTRDGAEAWAVLAEPDAPHLVILDWMMPGTDGLDVCRRLRAQESGSDRATYVIVLTALGDRQRVAEGLDAGADDYLVKPFDPVELRARIDVGRRVLALQSELRQRAADLREALAQVKTLRGLIPMCCHCKRIRDDADYWHDVSAYVSAHTEAMFSHGLCPECSAELYPEDEE